ncbi:hypothetical protein MPSEU_001098000 [Mayamaea pseudoterrestris]|nr:hypothetical protein MPSEU_001098000 [Mayamaea pseudoterrestris]
MTSTATLQSTASSQPFRTKFLTSIGLHHPVTPHTDNNRKAYSPSPSTSSPSSVMSTIGFSSISIPNVPYRYSNVRPPVSTSIEPLKYDPLADAHYSKRRISSSSRNISNKKRIVFSETVKVIPIPMRTEYSTRVKSRLWTNGYDLYENSRRNTIEFAYEGWNWRNVTEDENMHVCVATGELIHPCHYAMRGSSHSSNRQTNE